MSVNKPSTERK